MNMTRKIRRRGVRRAVAAVGGGLVLASGLVIPASPFSLQQTTAEAATPATPAPLLWKGVLKNAAGTPVSGTVTISARPTSSAIATMSMLNVATVTANGQGQFEVKLPYTAALDAYKDKDGVIGFVATSLVGSEVSIAINELKYLPVEGVWADAARATAYSTAKTKAVANGANPAAFMTSQIGTSLLGIESTEMSSMKAGDSNVALGGSPVVSKFQAAANAGGPVANQAGPPNGGQCQIWGTGYLPDSPMMVASLLMEKSTYWDNSVTYDRSGTTSTTVGASASGSGIWKVSGSVTMGDNSARQATSNLGSSVNTKQGRKFGITASNKLITWKCWTGQGPPPVYPGSWPTFYTVEKEGWIRDWSSLNVDQQSPSCDQGIAANQHTVGGNTTTTRSDGSSEAINASFSITFPGNGYFSGGAEISVANSQSNQVSWAWHNNAPNNKYVCGIGGNPWSGRRVIPVAQGWDQ